MNKTKFISAALLLAAGTAFADAATVLTDITGKMPDSTTYNDTMTITGILVDLDALTWSPGVAAGTNSITLSSINFVSTGGSNSNAKFFSGSMWAFIYEGSVTPNSVSTTSTTLVGKSSASANWNSNSNSNNATWNFTNLVLDYSKSYSILFSSNADSFVAAKGNSGSGEGIRTSANGTANNYSAVKVFNYNGSSVSGNAVNVTLTAAVPEPSAFGLLAGLGALALVASRRRRSPKAA